MWICALNMPREHIPRRSLNDFGAKRRRIDLAIPDNPAGGREFHEDKVPPTSAGRRVADDEDVEIG
jgi:hypothetical protein